MLTSLLPGRRRKRERIAATRAFVDAMNARNHADARPMMARDFTFVDAGGMSVKGRDEVLASDSAFRDANANAQVRILTIDAHDESVLVRGYLESRMAELAGETLWRVEFEDRKISSIHVTRAGYAVTLPKFAGLGPA
ncbi:nuclear transport factor 2 family protein [Erythrobacter sp.]|uniref:nuclear transport factor 2 family protein n=1 Tax=Erythrobacter sp. TaxID=1042 RepID=UPI001B2CAA30|nr:nuclear transport factor 2 family protein [Erythrobacter sp.]MBO6527873.1 nuclear transport factor 2 family protein [Erythrobacter sp.]MBO6528734.1 nuclear transport factor 2 family protein [Erythrobacter sp.]